jgi:16S rRNA G1207 methylase RsmC
VRATALAELNAVNLGVSAFVKVASDSLRELSADSYDVVLANPPYYAPLSIAQMFIERGRACLKTGGRFFLVTKQPDTVYPLVAQAFGEPEMFERRGYIVFRAAKGQEHADG